MAGTAVSASSVGVFVGKGVTVGDGVGWVVAVSVGAAVGVAALVGTAVTDAVGNGIAVGGCVAVAGMGLGMDVGGNGRSAPQPNNNSKLPSNPHRFNMFLS